MQDFQEFLSVRSDHTLINSVDDWLYWRVCPSGFDSADEGSSALSEQCSRPSAELALSTGTASLIILS